MEIYSVMFWSYSYYNDSRSQTKGNALKLYSKLSTQTLYKHPLIRNEESKMYLNWCKNACIGKVFWEGNLHSRRAFYRLSIIENRHQVDVITISWLSVLLIDKVQGYVLWTLCLVGYVGCFIRIWFPQWRYRKFSGTDRRSSQKLVCSLKKEVHPSAESRLTRNQLSWRSLWSN